MCFLHISNKESQAFNNKFSRRFWFQIIFHSNGIEYSCPFPWWNAVIRPLTYTWASAKDVHPFCSAQITQSPVTKVQALTGGVIHCAQREKIMHRIHLYLVLLPRPKTMHLFLIIHMENIHYMLRKQEQVTIQYVYYSDKNKCTQRNLEGYMPKY